MPSSFWHSFQRARFTGFAMDAAHTDVCAPSDSVFKNAVSSIILSVSKDVVRIIADACRPLPVDGFVEFKSLVNVAVDISAAGPMRTPAPGCRAAGFPFRV